MSGTLGGGIFDRLLSLWRSLKGDTVKLVDAVTNPASPADPTALSSGDKFVEIQSVEASSTTDGTDTVGAVDEFAAVLSGTGKSTTVDSSNEFVQILREDHSDIQESKDLLDRSCSEYRTDVPLEDLLQLSVGLHKNLEERIGHICDVVSDNGFPISSEKVELPETIPEAVHQGCAKEKALALKRGRLRRSQRKLYPTPRAEDARPSKVAKKDDPTDLKQLGLSKETRQLLELDSPLKPGIK